MLTEESREINQLVMREIGLELDNSNHIIDQDKGISLMYKNKFIKYNYNGLSRLGPDEIEFDPLNNSPLMSILCAHFLYKISEEDGPEISIFDLTNPERDTLGRAVARATVGGRIEGDPYIRDSLKFISLICKMNGHDINLKKYDGEVILPTKRKRSTKRNR